MTRVVEFSADRKYRYRLLEPVGPRKEILWPGVSGKVAFILLNPSTADEHANDPTVSRCFKRAFRMGFSQAEILNIFAWRSTDPKKLYVVADPVGADNDAWIIRGASCADLVICGWGRHGAHLNRGPNVVKLLRHRGVKLHCLGVNVDGTPKHPLYLPYETATVELNPT
jgi:hypothetical protein